LLLYGNKSTWVRVGEIKGFVDKAGTKALSLAAPSPGRLIKALAYAQVAELVDALASGASGRKVVEVRVFSWAPTRGNIIER
jgi:hypothetical protein